MQSYKDYFPIFKEHPNLIYLDSAATCQKPLKMIQSFSDFYTKFNANIGRGAYPLADSAQKVYNDSKRVIADFFDSNLDNMFFTYGATDSLNQVADIILQISQIHPHKKYLILSMVEHHSNILPWIKLVNNHGLKIYVTNTFETIKPSLIPLEVQENALAFICSHVSNVTGEILPIQDWIKTAHDNNAFSIIDGSQAVGACRVRINDLKCDFYLLSAHKMYGPMGLGLLFCSTKVLKYNPQPLRLGGGIVDNVLSIKEQDNISIVNYELISSIERFEAGTPNLANIYAFAQTINWMLESQWHNALTYMTVLSNYMYDRLCEHSIKTLRIDKSLDRTHIAAITIEGLHPHDLGTYLGQKNICIRSGKHCAYPLYDALNVNSSARISIGLYNNHQEINSTIDEIKNAINFFK
jgi:cysteine desulfurase/selenocysteine lyase